MSEQPTALRLAQCIEFPSVHLGHEAAAELRRLHEEVETCGTIIQYHEASIKRLGILNQELLGALKLIAGVENKMWGPDWEEIDEARVIARAAIAKAEGETK